LRSRCSEPAASAWAARGGASISAAGVESARSVGRRDRPAPSSHGSAVRVTFSSSA
jgi:hypothetical protein